MEFTISQQKCSDCRNTKSKHIDWTLSLRCYHQVWPWPWPSPWIFKVKFCNNSTVGTPYNTAQYITGSNIAWLGHGSQNSWSKLWIPIVKSAPVRVIFTWKSVPKKSIHGSSDIYLGTQWKQRHDSPWSYHSDVIITFLWYGTIGIIWHNVIINPRLRRSNWH